MKYLSYIFTSLIMFACVSNQKAQSELQSSSFTVEPTALTDTEKKELSIATFASGCFWCTEAVFEQLKGVKSVVSGYAGGEKPNPTYQEVSAGQTKYAESVQIYFDAKVISYDQLLEIFFDTHDPTQLNRQGPDVGEQYRSEIFYHDEAQKQATEAYLESLSNSAKFDKPIVTKISPLNNFYEAEDYHQNYYEHNPDNPYIINVTKPKVEKFEKKYASLLKEGVS